LITDDEAVGLEPGDRVYYTKKDGTRIHGEVRSVYHDKRMLSMKPDSIDEEHPAYNQTYRFRRLTIEQGHRVEFFGLQVAPLVVMASSKTTPEALQRVFSCKDGLFVTDGRKLVLEKIKGLKDGHVKDETLWELNKREIEGKKKFDESIIYARKNDTVDEYYEFRKTKKAATIHVNAKDFNRFIRTIPYSTGQYHAKWTDVATTTIVDDNVEISIFDKRRDFCSTHKAKTMSGRGTTTTTTMLHDLREFLKGIRTKEVDVKFYLDGTVIVETEEQLRILYPFEEEVYTTETKAKAMAKAAPKSKKN